MSELTELLRDALKYLEVAEANPAIEINMRTWINSWEDEIYEMGLAGCWFWKGGLNPKRSLADTFNSREASDVSTRAQLEAIDALSRGYLKTAMDHLDLYYISPVTQYSVANYADDPTGFKRDMKQILADLMENDYIATLARARNTPVRVDRIDSPVKDTRNGYHIFVRFNDSTGLETHLTATTKTKLRKWLTAWGATPEMLIEAGLVV